MIELFHILLVNPIINLLVAMYQILLSIGIPYALGFSIILLTILIRFVLYPFTASQLRVSHKMQQIAPHVNKLKEKHKGDTQRLQQATMALYKEHGVNPAAGCLPALVQLPVIWALYSVLQQVVSLKPQETLSVINKIVYFDFLELTSLWETTFFGIPLGQSPSALLPIIGPAIILVPFLTGVFQFLQSKMMVVKKEEVRKDDKKKEEPDFATAFQAQTLYIFPVMIGIFSFQFPIGLSLYWNTFTIFGMIQQYKLQGLGGLSELRFKKAEMQLEKKQQILGGTTKKKLKKKGGRKK